MVVAKVNDEGWRWQWGADFYVDLYLLTTAGEELLWRGGGEQSREDAICLQDSVQWLGERTIHFSSCYEEVDHALHEQPNGVWIHSAKADWLDDNAQ